MNRLFRTTVVETSGVRTIAGGGTNASTASAALINLGGATNTSLNAASSVLLRTSIYSAASGNWQSSYEYVNDNYENWDSVYTHVKDVSSNWFEKSGGIVTGSVRINNNLTIWGNLSASGTTTFANTVFSTTSALSVVHIGSGPAMWIGNSGTGDIASFYDIDQNLEILHVGGNNGTFPNVGVKTSQPNKDFTVNGEISATSHITTSGNVSAQGKLFGDGSSITNVGAETIMLGWNPPTDSNLGQAVDVFAPYDGSVWNTNTDVFEVINSNSSSPMTRVQIKNTGYYLFTLQLYCFDLKLNRDFLYMLFKSTTSTGAFSLVRYMSRKRHAEDTNAGLLSDEVSMLIRVDTANEFYNWAFNSEDASPYALAAPGNGIYTMSMQITKLRNL